jgi:hypothetical protein
VAACHASSTSPFCQQAARRRTRGFVPAELNHRLGNPDELMRPREIASEQRAKRLAVAVEHGEPLTRIPGSEPVLVLLRSQQ